MSLKNVNYLVFIVMAVHLLGCGAETTGGSLPTNNLLSTMSPTERQKKAPNKAFEGVYEKDLDKITALIDEDRQQFLAKNGEGDTPLMVAIRLREKDISKIIVENMSIDDLMEKDSSGRGYLSLAAEEGFVALIDQIATKYKASLKWGTEGFYNIDFADSMNRRALFYASTSAVAQRLENHWMQWTLAWGISWTWFSDFYQGTDTEEQNFIHTASAKNRFDVINWAKSEMCGDKLWSDKEFLMGGVAKVGEAVDWVTGLLQVAPGIPDNMFNQKNLYGDTPLHLATQFGNKEAVSALSSCRFTRYTVTNDLGRNPLANLIANADPNKAQIESARKEILGSLLHKQNRFRWWWNPIKDIVDAQDVEGKSALHYAAQLKDPYFYNQLKDVGNVFARDNDQKTPQDIFKARH